MDDRDGLVSSFVQILHSLKRNPLIFEIHSESIGVATGIIKHPESIPDLAHRIIWYKTRSHCPVKSIPTHPLLSLDDSHIHSFAFNAYSTKFTTTRPPDKHDALLHLPRFHLRCCCTRCTLRQHIITISQRGKRHRWQKVRRCPLRSPRYEAKHDGKLRILGWPKIRQLLRWRQYRQPELLHGRMLERPSFAHSVDIQALYYLCFVSTVKRLSSFSLFCSAL
ncbi:hypothetical protein PGT21_019581 [Puccinia graminis f. sp. tritici]|uniref:Uncharacterized protein n=1 Tax=Puccinia graminis f. sp. tritici TaxID=56615 RepID=A0A5B0M5A9_PUCGR|nr:hypothetical protein PGTUg99_011842 [Puccinia graminis f. sp. tritici]KAA1094375.1 hypothetical protein PGT21_019581 [Puccinia graminis f. sp. tritici]